YNIKCIIRVGELDRWFATNFGRYPLELTEPKMVEISKVAELIETLKDSRFRGQPIIGFDTEKVHTDPILAQDEILGAETSREMKEFDGVSAV
uniref:Uncharacterized protein n=1 Tax=Romanomermis culicivorax TaxID=13658 RepID=A0A915JZK0_ROMCU